MGRIGHIPLRIFLTQRTCPKTTCPWPGDGGHAVGVGGPWVAGNVPLGWAGGAKGAREEGAQGEVLHVTAETYVRQSSNHPGHVFFFCEAFGAQSMCRRMLWEGSGGVRGGVGEAGM